MADLQRIKIPLCSPLVYVATFVAVAGVVAGLWNSPSFAFGGCVQASPENPSLILGLLGGAVAVLPLLRAKLKSRPRKKLQLQRQ